MAKASTEQKEVLFELKEYVLSQMESMGHWDEEHLESLQEIPLAVLKKNATQRHGVTRFRVGRNAMELKTEDVETIDLHPQLLSENWEDYARFVLYHEYLHALGNRFHDSEFRRLEDKWPSYGSDRGREFTQFLRQRSATWLWVCATCDKKYPRKRKANGRFRCRICSTILTDVPNMQETN